MPEGIQQLKEKFLEFWNNLEKNQKTRLMISAGILILTVIIGLVVATKTDYVTLLRIEDSKQGEQIKTVLNDSDISYTPGEDGAVLVDKKDLDKAEFAIKTTPGLSEAVSFQDTWDLLKLSSTESDKKQLWKDYKKKSLIKQLKMFDNVTDADIDIAVPEQSLYFSIGDDDKATAYVRIKTIGEISSEQVRGVALVVANSIIGLNPRDVSVIDNNLNVLNSDMEDEGMERTSTQYEMRNLHKKDLEKTVRSLFSGRADTYDFIKVVANPVLDFDYEKSIRKDYEKPTGIDDAIISSTITTEKLENGTSNAEPGMGSNGNAPSYPGGNGETSKYDKKSNTSNRVFNEVQTDYEKAQGKIIYKDSSMTLTIWYGDRVADDKNITPQFFDQIKLAVAGATGIPINKISVSKFKLAPMEVIEQTWQEVAKEYIDTFGYFALMLMLMVALIIIAKPKKKVEEEIIEEELMFDEEGNPTGPKFVMPEEQDELPEIDLEERSEVKKQLDKFVQNKPDAVAKLLRNWLQDEWD